MGLGYCYSTLESVPEELEKLRRLLGETRRDCLAGL